MGVTEFSGYELTSGFATGVFHRDVKKEWGHCFKVVPEMIGKVNSIFTQVVGLTTHPDPFALISIGMSIFTLISGLFSSGQEDINSCTSIYTEASQVINFILHHLDPAQLLMNVLGNVVSHLFDIFGDLFGLVTAIFSMDFFKIGKNSGELLMMIIN